MRVRQSFVSNSSSSSFVILGAEVAGNRPEFDKLVSEYYESDKLQNKFYLIHLDNGNYIIGKLLADGEDQIDETTTTIKELKKMADDIAKDLSKIGITDEIKLLTGTRPS